MGATGNGPSCGHGSLCQLEEAKANYDQFLDPETGNPKRFFLISGVEKMRNQAREQNLVAAANTSALLHWHFMHPRSYRYFTRSFRTTAPLANAELKPL